MAQFRILYRDFLTRILDLELISSRGDIQRLLVQFAAVLAAFSFTFAVFAVIGISRQPLPQAERVVRAWPVEEFLVATTMAVAGLLSVLSWNALYLDRLDCLILGILPVRSRIVRCAKVAALASALGIAIIAINLFTGMVLPVLLTPPGISPLRTLAAHWTTHALAGLFIFCLLLAIQGLAAQLLTHRAFLRVSGYLQLGAFLVILAVYFLEPPFPLPYLLATPEFQPFLRWLPSYWFFGLYQYMCAGEFSALAARALSSVLVVVPAAAFVFALAYHRSIRRIVEQPDISPTRRARLTRRFSLHPVVLFTARTLARSRQHRLLMAAYTGIGLAFALAYVKTFLYVTFILRGFSLDRYDQPNQPFLLASLAVLFFAVVGARAVFALPIALPANWLFQITAVDRPASYFSAARNALLTLTVAPLCLASAILYLAIWPGRPALEHIVVLALAGWLLVELALHGFRKIPFTCSYLPGKANLHVKLGVYGILFLTGADLAARLELWSLARPARFAILFSVLLGTALWSRRRTVTLETAPWARVQFEDAPPEEILTLDLKSDGRGGAERWWPDSESRHPRRGFRLAAACALLLCAAGFAYESFGEWRDSRRFPQVGRSVDIGGRSLNLHCAGMGSPVVILDSGGNQPGYSWVLVERLLAPAVRVCWYDRAGYGWSDPAPGPHDSADAARDLYRLLRAAAVRPPYILVGHSYGGFNVRVFAAQHPREAAGLVLVDSADEFADRNPPPAELRSSGGWIPVALRPAITRLMVSLVHLGLLRLLDNGPSPQGLLVSQDAAIVHALQLQPKMLQAELEEGLASRQSRLEVQAIQTFGDLPLIVLTGGKSAPPNAPRDSFGYRWVHEIQARLVGLSTRGRQIVSVRAGHGIPVEDPHAVAAAVREILEETR